MPQAPSSASPCHRLSSLRAFSEPPAGFSRAPPCHLPPYPCPSWHKTGYAQTCSSCLHRHLLGATCLLDAIPVVLVDLVVVGVILGLRHGGCEGQIQIKSLVLEQADML